MKRAQTLSHGASAAGQAVRSGDSHGGGGAVDLSEGEN
jgi:type IV secretory pathway TrbL component